MGCNGDYYMQWDFSWRFKLQKMYGIYISNQQCDILVQYHGGFDTQVVHMFIGHEDEAVDAIGHQLTMISCCVADVC